MSTRKLPSTDEEILERCAPGCRTIRKMELKIVNRLLQEIASKGCSATIGEYEGEPTPDLKAALFNLDEAHVTIRQDGKRLGWIFLVFGNSGWDLISDYTVSLENFLKPIIKLSDELERTY